MKSDAKHEHPLCAKDIIYYYGKAKQGMKYAEEQMRVTRDLLEGTKAAFIDLREKVRKTYNDKMMIGRVLEPEAIVFTSDKHGLTEEEVSDLLR